MTQEEKNLLLVDLYGRLLYGVKCHCDIWPNDVKTIATIYPNEKVLIGVVDVDLDKIKPYLRPMSSMTEEERKEYNVYHSHPDNIIDSPWFYVDWLNKNHFDYRGLISMGLALKASEDMYN